MVYVNNYGCKTIIF